MSHPSPADTDGGNDAAAAFARIARAHLAPRVTLGEVDVDAWFRRPEHVMLACGTQVRRVRAPFVFRFLEDWSVLELGEAFPASPAAALHLRHAFEWRALRAAGGGDAAPGSLRALALVTACLSVHAQPRAMFDSIRLALPDRLRRVLDAAPAAPAWGEKGELAGLLAALPDAFGMDAQALEGCLARLGALVLPIEVLLTLGGDSRLRLDRELRLNKYGCSPMPRPEAITFASCTATSVSDLAFERADAMRRQMLLAALEGGAVEAAQARAERLRARIVREFALEDDSAVALAPSGTDCELLLTALALATGRQSLLHVAVGFDEAGSGTTSAARGRHFDVLTPRGEAVTKDAPVEGIDGDDVAVSHVALRGDRGLARPLAQIDASVETAVRGGLAQGRHVLLHAMDSSKTGLGGPSLELVRTLQAQAGERLWVVADAAQMRVSRETLGRYQRAGCMVVLTGSKFFTGPPFAGALAIPASLARHFDSIETISPGLGKYFCGLDLPPRWAPWLASARMASNPGLLLRWEASLAEVEAFHAVPDSARRDYFVRFRDGVLALFQSFPALEPLVTGSFHETTRAVHDDWDCVQSIFPFLTWHCHEGRVEALDMEQALRVYHFLNQDLSAALAGRVRGAERELAARQCHIGQPVAIALASGAVAGALRIAPGARFVARVHFDPLLGSCPRERIDRQLEDVCTLMRKTGLILEHWSALPDMKPRPSLAADPRQEALA